MKKTIQPKKIEAFNKRGRKISASEIDEIRKAWHGSPNYEHLFTIKLFGYRLEFWRER